MDTLYACLALGQLIGLFFISRQTIKKLFQLFRLFFKNDALVFGAISFIFLPGTIVHEMSHFAMATLLFLRVREIHIFPQWQGNYIKLGSVHYEKKDVLRSILVGLAPIFIGLLFFWWLSQIPVFTSSNLWLKIAVLYLVFIISTSMFSSKQDLVDIIYLIPIAIITGGILYIFDIDVVRLVNNAKLLEALSHFVYSLNIYLFLSLIMHGMMIGIIECILTIRQR